MPVGWFDITGSWDGKPLGIEVKTDDGVVSPEQKQLITHAHVLGWNAFVARSVWHVADQLGVPIE